MDWIDSKRIKRRDFMAPAMHISVPRQEMPWRTKFGEQKQEVLNKTSEFHLSTAFSFFTFLAAYVNLSLTVSECEKWGRQLFYYSSFFHNEENEKASVTIVGIGAENRACDTPKSAYWLRHVCLPAWSISAPTGWIFMSLYGEVLLNPVDIIQFLVKTGQK
jgi:hypothetical protein